jgi:hypothetical protein
MLTTENVYLMLFALSSRQKDQGNDPSISDNRRGGSDGWNTSRLGVLVFGMVQYLSLQKDGARPTASMHEPVHGGLSNDRIETKIARSLIAMASELSPSQGHRIFTRRQRDA